MTVSPIEIYPGDESARKLWEAVAKLANHLEPQPGWCLVGGLMVQLHAYEHAASPRPTSDIDLLGDARARPSVTEHLGKAIDELGGELVEPPSTDPALGQRFEVDGQPIDVLGPDGLKALPRTLGEQVTVEIPGGTQALHRSESVETQSTTAHLFEFYARPFLAQSSSRQGRSASTDARTTSEKTWSCS